MVDRERGQAGESLDGLAVGLVESPLGIPRADAKHAQHLVSHGHRRHQSGLEALVDRVREILRDARVVVRDDRAALSERDAGEAVLARRLEADQVRVEAVDSHAADDPPVGVVQVAVGSFGVEQARHFADEPLQHRVQP